MSEFGEKCKQAREAKGLTQQTLADRLYVTRQAVSRWECGARYPDLLTAKKLADALEVTLDELLSGEEQRRCDTQAPIAATLAAERVQSALFAVAAAGYALLALLQVTLAPTPVAAAEAVCQALLLAAGLALSLVGRLTARRAGLLFGAFFGLRALRSLATPLLLGLPLWPAGLAALASLACLAAVTRYFMAQGQHAPLPVYLAAGVAAVRNTVMLLQMMTGDPFEVTVHLLWYAASLGLMALLAYLGYRRGNPSPCDRAA